MQTAKNTLRKQIKAKLKCLSTIEKNYQSKVVAEKLFKNDMYIQSKRISVYCSMKNELQTPLILEHALACKKLVYIPKYVDSDMEMVKIHSMEDYESLPETSWHIKQPLDNDNTREEAIPSGGLDLIIVPGVGFTSCGDRLGHGKGYYDSYITKIEKVSKPYLIGLAFNVQICDSIPTFDHDRKLDNVLFSDQT